ncbi:MAG: hypothetical protein K2L22_02190 [Muribaculaceae bacterium]|nr:hypothetical protein [Muribaculaceae bacterium]
MTEEQKDILIGKMIDSPSSLTDEELDMILTDDELKDIYKISSDVMGACMPQPEMDVEREWRLFRHRILSKPSPTRWIMRVAAIFLGVMLASGILVKFTDYLLTDENKTIVASDAGKRVDLNDQVNGNNEIDHPMKDEEPISEMLPIKAAIPDARPAKTKRISSAAKKVEIEEEEIDIDEYLRLQQSEIDQEIAVLNAEMYLDEWDAMREFFGYMNGENMGEAETNTIIL